MAQHQPGNAQGWVDKQRSTAGSVAKSDSSVATPNNYDSHADLDTRLTAISATTYTAEVLNSMTLNDKQYAVRLNDDANTI